jgi:hypothetical protein
VSVAKAKRERRSSIRNMSAGDDALETLERLERLEKERAASERAADETAAPRAEREPDED